MSEKIPRRNILKTLGAGLLFPGTAVSGEKIKRVPRDEQDINFNKEDFAIFPERLKFKPGKKTVFISASWQIAKIYSEDGLPLKGSDNKLYEFLAATGKSTTPTPLGVYSVVGREKADYTSKSYPIRDRNKGGAPMPWAIKLAKYDNSMKLESYDGISIHGRSTSSKNWIIAHASHGCIGIDKELAKEINQKILVSGGYIVIFDENFPDGSNLTEINESLNGKKYHLEDDGWQKKGG